MKAAFPRAWWKRLFLIGGGLVVGLLAFLALALVCLHVSGRIALAQTQKELLTKGERLSLAELMPPPIHDEQNFFADPLWTELTDFVSTTSKEGITSREPRLPLGRRQLDAIDAPVTAALAQALKQRFPNFPPERGSLGAAYALWGEVGKGGDAEQRRAGAQTVLDLLKAGAPTIERIVLLSERAGSRFPFEYEHGFDGDSASSTHYITPYLTKISSFLQLRAQAELALGETEAARRDVLLILRLGQSLKNEPLLIFYLIRTAIISMAIEVLDRGIVGRQWTAPDLAAFAGPLSELHLINDLADSLRGERAFGQRGFDSMQREARLSNLYLPWLAGDRTFSLRHSQRLIESLENSENGPLNAQSLVDENVAELKSKPWKHWIYPLSAMSLPYLYHLAESIAPHQTRIVQTRIACALELYRLKNGRYPETLTTLAPDFIAKLPDAPITGKPINYRLVSPQEFKLWSVGWNLKDGGDIVWGRQ